MLSIRQAKQYTLEYLLEGEQALLDASKKNSTFNKQYTDSLFSQKNVLKNMREAEKAIQKAEKIFNLDEVSQSLETPQTERQSIYAAYFTSQGNTKKKSEEKDNSSDEAVSLKSGINHRLGDRIFNSKSLGSSQQHIQIKRMQSTGRLLEAERKGSEGSLMSSLGFQPFARERDSLGFIVNPKSDYSKEVIDQFHEKLPNMPSERQHISLIVKPSKDNILVLRKGVHFFEKGTQLKSRRRDEQLIQNIFPSHSSTFKESKGLSFREDKLVKPNLNEEQQQQRQNIKQKIDCKKLFTETSCKTLTLTDQLTTGRQYYPLTLETAADTPDSQNMPLNKLNPLKQQQQSNKNQMNHILDAESDLKYQFLPSLQPQTSRSKFSKDDDIQNRMEMEQQDDPYKLRQKSNINNNQRVHSTEGNIDSQEHVVSFQTLMESGVLHGNCQDPNCARNHTTFPQNTKEIKGNYGQAPRKLTESASQQHILDVNMKQKGKNSAPISLGQFSIEPTSEIKLKLLDRNKEQSNDISETNTPKRDSILNMRFKWQMNALDQALIFEQVRKIPSSSQQQSSHHRLRLLKPPTEDLSLFGSTPNPSPCNYHPRYGSVEKRTRDVIFDKAKVSDSPNPLFSTPIYTKEPPLTLEQQEILNKLAVQPVQVSKEEGYEVMFSEMMKDIKNEVRAQKILNKELQHPMKGLMLTPIPHPDIEELNKEIGGKLNYCKQCLSNLKYYLKADHPQIIRKQEDITRLKRLKLSYLLIVLIV